MVSRRPAVVCKAVGPLITENDVIQESDAEQFSGLSQARSKNMVFRAGRRIAGWMIVSADNVVRIE